MLHRPAFGRVVTLVLVFALLFVASGCGTILYPERQGQRDRGPIDPGVALLDGVCLLIFIIPGVIAFLVDFSTGAIYLPPNEPPDEPVGEPADEPVEGPATE